MTTVNIALLGYGRVGQLHAQCINRHPSAQLYTLFDLSPQARDKAKNDYPQVNVVESVDSVFTDKNIDAVIIATPSDTHLDMVELAVKDHKAVLCEKPLSLSLDRIAQARKTLQDIVAVNKEPSFIQVGFNRRFDPGHSSLHQAIKDNVIGTPFQLIITSRDPNLPTKEYIKHSGGLFSDMTIHDFDLARFLLGENPVRVWATGSALVDPSLAKDYGDIDTASVILQFANGAQCIINNCRQAPYGYDQRIEVLGSKGMVISDNKRPHEMHRYHASGTSTRAPLMHFFMDRYREAFEAQLDAFVHGVKSKSPPKATIDDGFWAQILAQAAQKAMTEQRIVSVSEIVNQFNFSPFV